MYYPILRGKQFELIALRELAPILPKGAITPVIEPVRENLKPLSVTINSLYDHGITPVVIINPTLGDFSKNHRNIYDDLIALSPEKFLPCIKTKNSNNDFTATFKLFRGRAAVFVEGSIDRAMVSALNASELTFVNQDKVAPSAIPLLKNIVLYKDSFNKQARNADYEEKSFYSSLHVEYKNFQNALGFGDYTILSEDYSESGGPAYVVTIHLSYIDRDEFDSMYIRHFSSFDDESPTNPGGKFKDALKKLIAYVNEHSNDFYISDGLKGLVDLNNRTYPGLGQVKKLSLKHHIETIAEYIKE